MRRVVIIGPETCLAKKVLAEETVAFVSPCEHSAPLQASLLGVSWCMASTTLRMSEQSIRIPATRRAVQGNGVVLYTALPKEFLSSTNWTALRDVPTELATAAVLAIVYGATEIVWYGRRELSPRILPLPFRECLRRRGLSVRCVR